jgi:hypothetical protein
MIVVVDISFFLSVFCHPKATPFSSAGLSAIERTKKRCKACSSPAPSNDRQQNDDRCSGGSALTGRVGRVESCHQSVRPILKEREV